ncbi:MAG: LPS export ABC transporter permease LptG [Syntrophobacterales bacterium]|nr:MAG: LPS export ABC transporter permease LptG [Syntrophobacterales bacterium]
MKILQRYICWEFIKILLLSMSAFILIYLVIDLFSQMNSFLRHKAPPNLVLLYFLYQIPGIGSQIFPIAILMATLLGLGILSRNNEITAMKANGISLYRITLPLLLLGILASGLCFIGNEFIVPFSKRQSDNILLREIYKKPRKTFIRNYKVWYRSRNAIYNFQVFNPKNDTLEGITLFEFDDNFKLQRRIDAKKALWQDDAWHFYDVTIRDFREGEAVQTGRFEERVIPIPETPDVFKEEQKDTEEMGYYDLRRYIRKIEMGGYDATRYIVDLYAKLSYPFACAIMVFLGIPFSTKTARSGGVALSFVMSIVIGFLYWIIFNLSLSLGHSGVLPPQVSAFAPHVLFGLTGMYALISIRQ